MAGPKEEHGTLIDQVTRLAVAAAEPAALCAGWMAGHGIEGGEASWGKMGTRSGKLARRAVGQGGRG